jgi:ATP-dependent DNA ligase
MVQGTSHVLQRLYESEINFVFGTFWDCGFLWRLGDELNGFVAEGHAATFDQAVTARPSRIIRTASSRAARWRMSRKSVDLPPFELTSPVLAKRLPTGPQWVHEIKHDGHRCAAVIRDGTVRLFTRNHRDMTRRFHLIATALLALRDHDAII